MGETVTYKAPPGVEIEGGVSVNVAASDIEIGAVEIKNSTDDTRATVGANGLHTDVRALPAGTVAGGASLPVGSSIIGKVGIDQTTPGTTNRVDIGAALPAGTNNIGDVDVLTLPAGTVAGSSSLPAGSNVIGKVDVNATVLTAWSAKRNSVTTTSAALAAAAATKGVVVKADANNTDFVDISPVNPAVIGGADTYRLRAGETIALELDNANKVFAVANSGTQILSVAAV